MTHPNINKKVMDVCPDCGDRLTQLHFDKYCGQCKKSLIQFEEELKIVPNNYRSNARDFKQNPFEKVKEHVKDILCLIKMTVSTATINSLVEKVLDMHGKRGKNSKGYREQSAAVIYYEFSSEHKLSIAQFCKRNNLEVKKFNKMYLIYKRILQEKETNVKEEQGESLVKYETEWACKEEQTEKISEENEECEDEVAKGGFKQELFQMMLANAQKHRQEFQQNEGAPRNKQSLEPFNKREEQGQRKKDQDSERRRQLIQEILKRIYDHVFDSHYLKIAKEKVIQDLIQKVFLVNQAYLAETLDQPPKDYFLIPCMIFGVIKAFKYKITSKQYIKGVEDALEVQLSTWKLGKFSKICNQILKNERGRDQLAEVVTQKTHILCPENIMGN